MSVVPFVRESPTDVFAETRDEVTAFLVKHVLIESHRAFLRHAVPYPYVEPRQLLPGTGRPSREHGYQNTAFVIMIDGVLKRSLVKHFRRRESNRVRWRNIQTLAPEIDSSAYKAEHARLSSPEAFALLGKLAALDYALMIERPGGAADQPCLITHMHVKVERLTDNAIKELGRRLGYVERRLFERGEDYADALERKFYEYYGFSTNASGRKSAAAMAAQLLEEQHARFAVFVAGQDDCRLTVLNESEVIDQYLLVRLSAAQRVQITAAARRLGYGDASPFIAARGEEGGAVSLYRARLKRTPIARGSSGASVDRTLTEPWLEILDEALVPVQPLGGPAIPLPWSGG